jgi:hypothetical protein
MADREWLLLGKKLNPYGVKNDVEMVYLSNLSTQWPWNGSDAKELEDKEIYSQMISPSETSDEWEIPIQPCMPGMAYVGIRVTVFGKHTNYSTYPRFVIGKNNFPLLGHPWDIQHCQNGEWTHLSYPMVPRLVKQPNKGSTTLLIAHSTPCFGKVELLAQKFDDLLEDDTEISYAYYDPILDEITIIHTDHHIYPANLLETGSVASYPRRVKILAPLRYILSRKDPKSDNRPYQLGVRIHPPW